MRIQWNFPKFSIVYVLGSRMTRNNIFPLLDKDDQVKNMDVDKAEKFNASFSLSSTPMTGSEEP